ncbi:HDR124Wp [Eremothecium sinecaudum]|uniref:HDR124Wp n=1 Tax=Eremothecium sinecaudum TaxID=45286 RepID=A0A120K299_9SACH|nr:HDR124Wp [Eremothecium sinecaudum]AMD20866.1 HDR124Wp [Eremothecium sinecaudum]
MQGGIRRKQDLLPRYKNGVSGARRAGGFLTTPVKKLLVYITLLLMVYAIVRMSGIVDKNEPTQFELKETFEPTPKFDKLKALDKSSFNNEVAMQQEVENLNKNTDESEKAVSSSNKKGSHGGANGESSNANGNSVKAVKHDNKGDGSVEEQAKWTRQGTT